MINTVGLGKTRSDMPRRESQRFHIENHAPFGRRVAGPLGMKKYIGGYPTAAFDFDGNPLDDHPWDFVVPESFTTEFFNNMWEWRTNDPEGIAIAIDEQRHCDHQSGYMMVCDVVSVTESGNKKLYEDSETTNLFFLEKRNPSYNHGDFVRQHREKYVSVVESVFADLINDHTVYYVNEVYNLIEGQLKDCLYDCVQHVRVDLPMWETFLAWRNAVKSNAAINGATLFDPSASAILVADVRVFVDAGV